MQIVIDRTDKLSKFATVIFFRTIHFHFVHVFQPFQYEATKDILGWTVMQMLA